MTIFRRRPYNFYEDKSETVDAKTNDMFIKEALLAIVVLGSLDVVWIFLINFTRYFETFSYVQGESVQLNITGGLIAYFFLLLLFLSVALPFARLNMKGTRQVGRGILWAGQVGFCAYGIYNATNFAVFKRYSPIIALMDTLWGGVLYALTAGVVLSLSPTSPALDLEGDA